jgi:DNA modification methylase
MTTDTQMINKITRGHVSAESRWARFGPYYAMFPMEFACNVVSTYSKQRDFVLDPFAGRGSSIFAAAALERSAFGIEINPVGWLYSTVKLHPASREDVYKRISVIIQISDKYKEAACEMSEFFRKCFSDKVLRFLLATRECLNWKKDNVDSTLMAFILLHLHGKRNQSLSNQMPMTKSTSINYSLEWWKRNGLLTPPEIDIADFFGKRFKWRYAKGIPAFSGVAVTLGDSTTELQHFYAHWNSPKEVKLLFTSPPYFGVTNYFIDQWLRMWVLGGTPEPTIISDEKYKNRFNSKKEYEELLDIVFGQCALMMASNSTVYVRTDVREFTLETTRKVLKKHFPDYDYKEEYNYCTKISQTELLNNSSEKPSEMDIILQK